MKARKIDIYTEGQGTATGILRDGKMSSSSLKLKLCNRLAAAILGLAANTLAIQADADDVVRTNIEVDSKMSQPTVQEHYPPKSMRRGEQGSPTIQFCVGPNGRVTDAKVAKSSGYDRIDAAAVEVVLLYRFKPATENGTPVAACSSMPVMFKLR